MSLQILGKPVSLALSASGGCHYYTCADIVDFTTRKSLGSFEPWQIRVTTTDPELYTWLGSLEKANLPLRACLTFEEMEWKEPLYPAEQGHVTIETVTRVAVERWVSCTGEPHRFTVELEGVGG